MASIDTRGKSASSPAFELASRQASLAFTRTLVSIDLLLMSVIRTSLNLIGFGFAMALFLDQMSGAIGVDLRVSARNFGLCLIAMGVVLITIGLVEHRQRLAAMTSQIDDLYSRNLLLEPNSRHRSPVAFVAGFLLLSGILVVIGVAIRIRPFG